MREKIYKSFEQGALAYLSQIIVVIFVILFTVESVPQYNSFKPFFELSDKLILGIFSLEYFLRLWSSPSRLKYCFSFFGIVDLVSILPSYLTFGFVDIKTIRIFRFIRMFKVFNNRYLTDALSKLKDAFLTIKYELIIFSAIAFIFLYMAAVGIYIFEHEVQPKVFSSIPACLWWAMTSLTTVGYGDAYPITTGGRIFTAFVLYIGLGIVAVPTGLIASAFTLEQKEQKEQKEQNK